MYTTLQIKNVDVSAKEKAEKFAKTAGFTSLQDVLRLFIIQISSEKIDINLEIKLHQDEVIENAVQEYLDNKFRVVPPTENFTDKLKGYAKKSKIS